MSQKVIVDSVAYQIFNTPWLCQIQEMYRQPDNQLKEVGYHTTGNKQWDKELMKNWVTCYLTIAQMVTFHSRGAGVVICNTKNAADIYRLLYKHLDTWRIIVERSINNTNPPIDDLRLMDAFAASIYPIAAPHMEKDSPVTGLMARLSLLGGINKMVDDGTGLQPKRITGIKRRRFISHEEEQKVTDSLGSGFSNTIESEETPQVETEARHNPVSDSIAKSINRRFGQWG